MSSELPGVVQVLLGAADILEDGVWVNHNPWHDDPAAETVDLSCQCALTAVYAAGIVLHAFDDADEALNALAVRVGGKHIPYWNDSLPTDTGKDIVINALRGCAVAEFEKENVA